jgi:glycosyltransferase involved in cell wall biosynthesis
MPQIAVIMPVHNAARTLDAAVESVLKQTFKDFELILVDDGSTDNSLEKLKKWTQSDNRIRVFSLPQRGGIVKALNFGFVQTECKFIARMDADDISLPERFERQFKYLDLYSNIVAVGTWVRFVDEADLPIFTYRTPLQDFQIKAEVLLGNGGAMIHPTLLMRRSALDSICDKNGNLYRLDCDTFEDLDLYYRLMHSGDFANVDEVLLLYRQHFSNTNFSERKFGREPLKFQRINAVRASYRLEPLIFELEIKKQYDLFQKWAGWARDEGYWKTAFKYAIKALLLKPWRVHSWQFIKFVCASFLSQSKEATQRP